MNSLNNETYLFLYTKGSNVFYMMEQQASICQDVTITANQPIIITINDLLSTPLVEINNRNMIIIKNE